MGLNRCNRGNNTLCYKQNLNFQCVVTYDELEFQGTVVHLERGRTMISKLDELLQYLAKACRAPNSIKLLKALLHQAPLFPLIFLGHLHLAPQQRGGSLQSLKHLLPPPRLTLLLQFPLRLRRFTSTS